LVEIVIGPRKIDFVDWIGERKKMAPLGVGQWNRRDWGGTSIQHCMWRKMDHFEAFEIRH
jgi:hypothetical protein